MRVLYNTCFLVGGRDMRKSIRLFPWLIVCWLIILHCPKLSFGDELPSAQEIADGIRQYIKAYKNLQFEYTVNATFGPNPTFHFDATGNPVSPTDTSGEPKHVNTNELFRILPPASLDAVRPWRYWQRSVNDGRIEDVGSFIAFNGQVFSMFVRREKESKKDYNVGQLLPFENPIFYQDNILDFMMCKDLNDIAEFDDPDWKLSAQLDFKWKVEGTREQNGRIVYLLRGQRDVIERVAHVVPCPDGYLVIHRESLRMDEKNGTEKVLLSSWNVTALGQLDDGFLYPKTGAFFQSEQEHQAKIEYSFDVQRVSRIDDSARKNWAPPWPPGTAVGDRITDKNFTVPHAPGQLLQISKTRGDLSRPGDGIVDIGPGMTRTRLLILVFNVAIVVTLLVLWLRKRLASKSAGS
jgi:hypothetical protein